MDLKVVLLDLDGTLWDSIPWYATILADLSDHRKEDLALELLAGGNVMRLAGTIGIGRATLVRACKRSVDSLLLYPGVDAALSTLVRRGARLGVVTGLPGVLATSMASAKGIFGRCEVFESARFGRAPKPSPAGILDALASLSVVPDSDVLYVGDQAIDAVAAERAGISFVWARYGYGQLHDEPRIAEIAALSELLDL